MTLNCASKNCRQTFLHRASPLRDITAQLRSWQSSWLIYKSERKPEDTSRWRRRGSSFCSSSSLCFRGRPSSTSCAPSPSRTSRTLARRGTGLPRPPLAETLPSPPQTSRPKRTVIQSSRNSASTDYDRAVCPRRSLSSRIWSQIINRDFILSKSYSYFTKAYLMKNYSRSKPLRKDILNFMLCIHMAQDMLLNTKIKNSKMESKFIDPGLGLFNFSTFGINAITHSRQNIDGVSAWEFERRMIWTYWSHKQTSFVGYIEHR